MFHTIPINTHLSDTLDLESYGDPDPYSPHWNPAIPRRDGSACVVVSCGKQARAGGPWCEGHARNFYRYGHTETLAERGSLDLQQAAQDYADDPAWATRCRLVQAGIKYGAARNSTRHNVDLRKAAPLLACTMHGSEQADVLCAVALRYADHDAEESLDSFSRVLSEMLLTASALFLALRLPAPVEPAAMLEAA